MADQEVLSDVLRRFASTMTKHYEIIDVLYDLTDHAVEVFDAAGAGVAVFDDDDVLRFVTATSEAAVAAEKAQERAQAGPCYSSIEEGRPLPISDVRDHADRWPDYVATVTEHGLSAVLGVPLVIDDKRIGSKDVYDHGPRDWSESDSSAATVLAAIAAAYMYNASEHEQTRRTAEQLQIALDSRVVIEQAKGMLAARRNISANDAFASIRRHARSHNLVVRSVAERIVDQRGEVRDIR